MKKNITIAILLLTFMSSQSIFIVAQNQSAFINLEDSQLRKISFSKIIKNLTHVILSVAKITCSKTAQGKEEATLLLVGSIVKLTTDAVKKHKKHKKESSYENTTTQNEIIQSNTSQKEIEPENDLTLTQTNNTILHSSLTETKSIKIGYLEQIQALNSDDEKTELINSILNNKYKTEEFIDELNNSLKNIFLNVLFE